MNKKSLISDIFFVIVLLSIIIIFPRLFIFADVSGNSMYPTLNDGDYLFVSRVEKPSRGDIVILKRNDNNKFLIKRVIGVSGDTIEFTDDCLLLNGEILQEDYINNENDIVYTPTSYTVSNNCFYVLGDNRNESGDSRFFGEIERSEILGVMKFNLSVIGLTQSRLKIMLIIVFVLFLLSLISNKRSSKLKE